MQDELASIYEHIWSAHDDTRFRFLDSHQDPRGPDFLFELADTVGVKPDSVVVDLGCGRGYHAVELSKRYQCRIIALDPLEFHVEEARKLASEAGLADRIRAQVGTMEQIPLSDGEVDFIWFRDALEYSMSVRGTLQECRRVLCIGGHLLLHSGYVTDRISEWEQDLICQMLGLQSDSLEVGLTERELVGVGFDILRHENLGSELAEFYELRYERCSQELLRLARLLRQPARFKEQLGNKAYDVALGVYHWTIYQFLGKVEYRTFLAKAVG